MNEITPLDEVFIRARRGLDLVHVGRLRPMDAEHALEYARDTYIRRSDGASLWVVPSTHIHASQESDADAFYEPMDDKPYRHATHYVLPASVDGM